MTRQLTAAASMLVIAAWSASDRHPVAVSQAAGGTISGVVVHAGDALPVNGAIVTVQDAQGSFERTAITDPDGRFVISSLPAGRYTVVAEKAGYVTLSFGASRFGQPGSAVVLPEGTTVGPLRIDLPNTAAIAGSIRLPDGRPAARAAVAIGRLLIHPDDGQRRFSPLSVQWRTPSVMAMLTDSEGQFRLYGLPPGNYVVRATAPFDPIQGNTFSYTYYPGTPDHSQAEVLLLHAGQELEMALTLTLEHQDRTPVIARVRGGGDPLTDLRVRMGPGPFASAGAIQPDGTFRFAHVPPGRYLVEARATNGTQRVWGRVEVVVNTGAIPVVDVDLSPGRRVSGRALFDGAARSGGQPPATVTLQPILLWQGDAVLSAEVDSSGRFEIGDVLPGTYRIGASVGTAGGGADQWHVEAILLEGRDVADEPVSVPAGHSIGEVVVQFSTVTQRVSGWLVGQDGRTPNVDAMVVVFPANTTDRIAGSRRVQYARPATDGTFEFAGLPAGAYRLVAVRDLDPEELKDPRRLETLLPGAIALELAPGEQKAVALRTSDWKEDKP